MQTPSLNTAKQQNAIDARERPMYCNVQSELLSLARWCVPVVPAMIIWAQKFETSLGNIVRPHLKKRKKERKNGLSLANILAPTVSSSL